MKPLHASSRADSELTGVRVGGAHHDHGRADPGGLSEAQTVVLLLGEHRHLVVGVVHIDDDLTDGIFLTMSTSGVLLIQGGA